MNLAILDRLDHQPPAPECHDSFLPPAHPPPSLTTHWRYSAPGKLDTNVRPKGQAGTREGALPDRTVPAEGEDRQLLEVLVRSKIFKEFERAFSETTGLPVASPLLSCPQRRSAPLPNEVRQDTFDP
jgi:hypothetical protein